MSNLKDGGPAFARPGFTERETESQEGMSLRDWFAGQALMGRLSNQRIVENMEHADVPSDLAARSFAQWSYEIADAMLKEREKS